MVIVRVPVVALEVVLMVIFEVPDPGAAIEVGLNVMVSPLPWPDADKLIAESKLPEATVVMVDDPELPRVMESEVGEAETVKAAGDEDVTVSEIVAVWVTPPPVPVTVIVYVPNAVVDGTVIVAVDVPEPGAAIEAGLNPTVTPLGWPLAVNATAESNPSSAEVVMVELPALPWTTEREVGEAESVNVGVWLVGAKALIRPAAVGAAPSSHQVIPRHCRITS